MNDDTRRRRRLDDGEGNGWLSMIALIVVVVLVGLLLGAILARIMGARTTVIVSPSPLPTIVVTAEPSLSPLPSESAMPTQSPAPTPLATATPAKTAAPSASPVAAVTGTPAATVAPAPTAPPAVASTATPVAKRPKPAAVNLPVPVRAAQTPVPRPKHTAAPPAHVAASAGPQTATGRAEGVVRLYLDALAHGNTAEARSYLSSGDPSESSFMDSSAHVTSIRTTKNADGTYKVDADLTTSSGEYYITFVVVDNPTGDVITDHVAIKP